MNKRYLLILKDENNENIVISKLFYTLEEAKITANVENKQGGLTTIIDLKDNKIKGQGCE